MAIEDNLDDDKTDEKPYRIEVNRTFESVIQKDDGALNRKTTSLKPAKNLQEVYQTVGKAIENLQTRADLAEEHKIVFVEGMPDKKILEELASKRKGGIVSFSLIKREPGSFSQGAPFEGAVRNMKPIFREEADDPENPGYKVGAVGYWHDNIIRFTCWANTNKRANELAQWFEDMMDEYMWYFKAEGINRMLFWGRSADSTENIDGNKWYGRPIDYFVRTEKIKVFSEKTIEKIVLSIVTKQE